MKALITTAYGDVDQLTVANVPEPQIGPGGVKVRVSAASINPMDWKLLSGEARSIMPLHFPAILGRDVSGEVLEVGKDVKTLHRGDHVLGLASSTFAELVVAAENVWAIADHVCRGGKTLGPQNAQRRDPRHDLRPIDERESFLGRKRDRLQSGALQRDGTWKALAFERRFAFADEREGHVRERR